MADDAIIDAAAETVEDGQTGPLGDRERTHLIGPVASTTSLQAHELPAKSGKSRAHKGFCDTTMLHTVVSGPSENGGSSGSSRRSGCDTSLGHEPSSRSPSPSSRSPRRQRRNPPGLIVRGTIYHVRIRVPRNLEAQVGR